MEQKEDKSASKAMALQHLFDRSFYKMSYTVHPSDIEGESQGKSSNENWAAKQVMKDYPDGTRENVLLTVMDGWLH